MRTAWVGIVALVASAGVASAQCCGDCNSDGRVSINELITAVNRSTDGCDAGVRTPSRTPTRTPTAMAGSRCPFDFADDSFGNQQGCSFVGRFNSGCGGTLSAAISGNGAQMVVVFDTTPVVGFGATVTNGTTATLLGWSTDSFNTTTPVAGEVRLENNGARLVLAPTTAPFTVDDCSFARYTGQFDRYMGGGKRLEKRADLTAQLDRLRQWQARQLPNLGGRGGD